MNGVQQVGNGVQQVGNGDQQQQLQSQDQRQKEQVQENGLVNNYMNPVKNQFSIDAVQKIETPITKFVKDNY